MADKRAFFKVDVGYFMNPKVAAVLAESPTAVLLHLQATAYSAQHLTDGVAPLALIMRVIGATQDDAELLFKRGLLIDRHDGDVEVHDYLEHQRSAAEAKKLSEAGKKGAAGRWGGQPDSKTGSDAKGNADRMRTPMAREREEREKKEGTYDGRSGATSSATSKTPRARGTRLPESFTVTPEMREWAARETPGLDLARATAEFADYWRGVAGSKGVKLDWIATWRNDMRRKAERMGIQSGSTLTAAPRYKTADEIRRERQEGLA